MQLCFVVASFRLDLALEVVHVLKHRVLPHHFEAHVNVEKHPCLLHDKPSIEPWPHLDLMSSEVVSLSRVEALASYALKLDGTHHRAEEDLEEVEVLLVCFLRELDPFDGDLVLNPFMLSLIDRDVSRFLERVDAEAIVYVEVK